MNENSLYTLSVENVPDDYNNASSAYKRHIWIAVLGIGSFFVLYLFLTFWFFYTAWRLLGNGFGGGNGQLMSIGGGFAAAFLGVFMIKAFFFVKTNHDVEDHQVTPSNEPLLFDYLHKLADEIGAPRPHKVYISNRVNAAVFYDLSFLNLFWPSKKNLEIGLGLMNVLNLGELKAVLAHEFGHFAQKSMLVGRWVYIANQIASAIISRRDALDRFLQGLSRIDIRIAWIGWILSLIVWSIRSLVEIVFKIVVLSQRALSREMEFQADLVAVSVTGSDALIHALHKLQAADAAFSNSLSTLNDLVGEKKIVPDLYTIQTNAVKQTARVLNDSEYGESPKVPIENPENFRVFSERIAQPPKMWATHPPDQEREANAKERYISGNIDEREAWVLFADAKALRLKLTSDLYKSATLPDDVVTIDSEEVIAYHNQQYDKEFFNSKYRGVYLNRNIFQDFTNVSDIYNPNATIEPTSSFYPESLVDDLEDYTTLRDELFQLQAIKDKRLTQSGSALFHRGVQVSRQQLPEIISGLKDEVKVAKGRVSNHDLTVRNAHVKMAESIGQGWPQFLKGVAGVIHYTEHTMEDLKDAFRVFSEVLQIVMADNKVTSKELQRVLQTGNAVQMIMQKINIDKDSLTLDADTQERLGQNWPAMLPPAALPRATQENVNKWVQNCSGWVGFYLNSLQALRTSALSSLLAGEEKVQQFYQNQNATIAPASSSVAFEYRSFEPGKERVVADKLTMWDKFVMSDGIVPSVAKFGVAASIVGATVFAGGQVGQSDLTIYNGLDIPVHVDVGHSSIDVPPHTTYPTHINLSGDFNIVTHDKNDKLIEEFNPNTSGTSRHYVYNIANAALLYEEKVLYTSSPNNADENQGKALGTTRWMHTNADYIFEDPPEELSTSSDRTYRDVLRAYSNVAPSVLLNLVENEEDAANIVSAHTKWDPPGTSNVLQWISIADNLGMNALIDERADLHPEEIITLRYIMDRDDESKANICESNADKLRNDADNPVLNYIANRCLPKGDAKNQGYISGAEKWPDHNWFNYGAAAIYGMRKDWKKSHDAYMKVYQTNSSLQIPSGLNALRTANYLRSKDPSFPVDDLSGSEILYYYSSQTDNKNQGNYDAVWHYLNEGDLEKAESTINSLDGDNAYIHLLIGASDGATKELVQKALEQTFEEPSEETLLTLVGLSIREGKSIEKYQELIESAFASEEIETSDFIRKVRNSDFRGAETIMGEAALSTQASLASFAYLVRGNRIPNEWKQMAKHLLFPSERPFIK